MTDYNDVQMNYARSTLKPLRGKSIERGENEREKEGERGQEKEGEREGRREK